MKFDNYPELINHHKEHIKVDWALNDANNTVPKKDEKHLLVAYDDNSDSKLEHIIKSKLVDVLHPVGSVILTVNTNFNPEIQFGGVWTKWTDGYLKVDSTPSTDKDDVKGATDYKITKDMLPTHTHDISHTHDYTPTGTIDPITHDHNLNYGDESKDSEPNNYNTIEVTSSTQTEDYMKTQNTTFTPVFNGLPGTTTAQTPTTSGDGGFANNAYKPGYYAVIAWQRVA